MKKSINNSNVLSSKETGERRTVHSKGDKKEIAIEKLLRNFWICFTKVSKSLGKSMKESEFAFGSVDLLQTLYERGGWYCPSRLCKTYIAQLGFIWSAYIHLFMAESGYILVTIVYLQYDVIMMPLLFLLLWLLLFICTCLIYILICLFTYVIDLYYYYYYYYQYFWRWL